MTITDTDKNITVLINRFEKHGKKWVLTETETHRVNKQYHKNVVDSKSFFVNLGGTDRHVKSATPHGYDVTRITSISPDKLQKTTHEFIFSE